MHLGRAVFGVRSLLPGYLCGGISAVVMRDHGIYTVVVMEESERGTHPPPVDGPIVTGTYIVEDGCCCASGGKR